MNTETPNTILKYKLINYNNMIHQILKYIKTNKFKCSTYHISNRKINYYNR